jgi:protein-S-isoprenylcysteine O-methyltransferase Ste14
MNWLTPVSTIYVVWLAWAVSWGLAAVWASGAQSRPGLGVEAAHRVVTLVGVVFLFLTASHQAQAPSAAVLRRIVVLPLPAPWTTPLWTLPEWAGWACVGLSIAGFAFAWWARIHLGTLWSGSITRKADHHIVDTGPYGLVRHPIYTGLIAAALALLLVKATPAACVGACLMSAGFWIKARFEEGFLRKELGAEVYDAYRKRVPMLVPFSPV